ncbi:hypothetical protein [Moritella sp. Urea-trap-13]|uniref:hypothetical protein n=1 Tax=Moritella sp. Urea-trap-13 TaxID=2058327 RepID=UPI000C31CD07|nr:hypothetical protein [Moritella sp. Urea-trap-13]PKH07425.1 hypothetical protein CXF93_07050 [Moritella sp. Urea-trap-13]
MKKTIAMMGISLVATGTAVAAPQVFPFVEVAIYRVKQPKLHPVLLNDVMQDVKAMPGFISSIHLRSMTEPDLFADISLWEGTNVTRTAKSVGNSFLGGASELKVFGYFQSTSSKTELDQFIQSGAVIELAAYSVKDITIQEQSRPGVYLELQNSSSFYTGMALSSVKTNGGYVDFIAWASQQAAEETAAKIMAMPEHQAFFQNTAEMALFDFFTVYDQNGLLK